MKKIVLLFATAIISITAFAQGSSGHLTPAQVKAIWEPRVMPSAVNIDSTFNAVVFQSNDRYFVTTSDFTKTTTTTASVVTGLTTDSLTSGATYIFQAVLFGTASGTGGYKVGIAGNTLTATNIIYNAQIFNVATDSIVKTGTATGLSTTLATLPGLTYATALITISGTIKVNAAGTLYVTFGQGSSNASSVIKQGSYLYLRRLE